MSKIELTSKYPHFLRNTAIITGLAAAVMTIALVVLHNKLNLQIQTGLAATASAIGVAALLMGVVVYVRRGSPSTKEDPPGSGQISASSDKEVLVDQTSTLIPVNGIPSSRASSTSSSEFTTPSGSPAPDTATTAKPEMAPIADRALIEGLERAAELGDWEERFLTPGIKSFSTFVTHILNKFSAYFPDHLVVLEETDADNFKHLFPENPVRESADLWYQFDYTQQAMATALEELTTELSKHEFIEQNEPIEQLLALMSNGLIVTDPNSWLMRAAFTAAKKIKCFTPQNLYFKLEKEIDTFIRANPSLADACLAMKKVTFLLTPVIFENQGDNDFKELLQEILNPLRKAKRTGLTGLKAINSKFES